MCVRMCVCVCVRVRVRAMQRKVLVLVIANALYDGIAAARLHEAVLDSAALHRVLTERGVQSVTDGPVVNAGKAAMERALRHLLTCVRSGDTVLLHYSGHGVVTANGFYLVPVDAST
jgi:hypothetical protein